MPQIPTARAPIRFSPLVLSDRLLTLAKHADDAGLRRAASHLVLLAHEVFDYAE